MLNIEIDGKALEVENGSSIIDAADKLVFQSHVFATTPSFLSRRTAVCA